MKRGYPHKNRQCHHRKRWSDIKCWDIIWWRIDYILFLASLYIDFSRHLQILVGWFQYSKYYWANIPSIIDQILSMLHSITDRISIYIFIVFNCYFSTDFVGPFGDTQRQTSAAQYNWLGKYKKKPCLKCGVWVNLNVCHAVHWDKQVSKLKIRWKYNLRLYIWRKFKTHKIST